MNQLLATRLKRAFALTHDLCAHLAESALLLDIPGLPSNTIGGQAWCIVGARESYLRALEAGGWQGFACSLISPVTKAALLGALTDTHRRLEGLDFSSLDAIRLELAFKLLEHEVQHHGQLIRFIYANRLTFPVSWNERYTV